MAGIAQTIAIVDKSGRVVSTSKQLKNVFKEAKLAYLERKAEIVAERRTKEDRELRKSMKAMSVADSRPSASRHHSHTQRDRHHERRPSAGPRMNSARSERSHHSGRHSISGSTLSRDESCTPPHTPLGEFNEEIHGLPRSAPTSPVDSPRSNELVRRRTDMQLETSPRSRPYQARSHSVTDLDANVDMDLAYGEFHPESLALNPRVEQQLQKQELSSLVTKCKMLLEEANCAQHSVKAMVSHLQKNPDAMAAVALTLAEISNLASKMAPGALMAFKSSAPAVMAILAAPEFLIAVGLGVGITVVMFGGYKIIKKIKAKANSDKEKAGMDEMLEIGELDRIEHWRRGIADEETASVATSVEGEFITPMAAASMGHLPMPKDRSKKSGNKKSGKSNSQRSRNYDTIETDARSEQSSRSRRSHSSNLSIPSERESRDKAMVKVKKPSPLRRMFNSRDKASSTGS